MPITKLTLEIDIPEAQSLKDRRRVVRSIRDGLRHGFNISIAELDETPLLNRATFGVVAISGSRDYLVGLLAQVERAAIRLLAPTGAQIVECYAEFLDEVAEE